MSSDIYTYAIPSNYIHKGACHWQGLATTIRGEAPRAHEQRHMIVVVRIIDSEANRNGVEKGRSSSVRSSRSKIVSHEKRPLVRSHYTLGTALKSWPCFETTIVVRHEFSNKTCRLGWRQSMKVDSHLCRYRYKCKKERKEVIQMRNMRAKIECEQSSEVKRTRAAVRSVQYVAREESFRVRRANLGQQAHPSNLVHLFQSNHKFLLSGMR
jgi:hypothetical protein